MLGHGLDDAKCMPQAFQSMDPGHRTKAQARTEVESKRGSAFFWKSTGNEVGLGLDVRLATPHIRTLTFNK